VSLSVLRATKARWRKTHDARAEKWHMTEGGLDLGKDRIIKAIAVYVPGSIVPAAISFASISVFTRLVSPSGYGRYSLVINAAGLIILLSTQWIEQAVQRYLPVAGDAQSRNELRVACVAAVAIVIAILLIVGVVALPLFIRRGPNAIGSLLLPAVIYVIFSCIYNMEAAVMRAMIDAKSYVIFKSMFAAIQFGAKAALLLMVLKGDPSALVWGSAIATGLLLPFMWRNIRIPNIRSLVRGFFRTTTHLVRDFAIYGIPLTGWYVASMLLSVGDRYVIQLFLGDRIVGIYSANYQLIEGLSNILFAPFLLAIHPYMIGYWRRHSREETGLLLGQIQELLLVAGIVGCGLAWVFAEHMSSLLGVTYGEGYVILPWVFAGVFLWNLGLMAHKPLEFEKKTLAMMAYAMGCAILNLALNFIAVPILGYKGAAYSTFISYLGYVIVVGIKGKNILNWRLPHRWWTMIVAVMTIAEFLVVKKVAVDVGGTHGYGARTAVEIIGAVIATISVVVITLRRHPGALRFLKELGPNKRSV